MPQGEGWAQAGVGEAEDYYIPVGKGLGWEGEDVPG